MAYQAISFTFGEQPSAAKWNILGTNDASFNDGTGVANLSWATTSLANPYKFHAWGSGSTTLTLNTFTKVLFATEEYDSNNNFATSTYTVPVAGFYHFDAAFGFSAGGAGERYGLSFYKNGAEWKRCDFINAGAAVAYTVTGSTEGSLAINDTIEVYGFNGTGGNKSTTAAQTNTYFSGHLISKT